MMLKIVSFLLMATSSSACWRTRVCYGSYGCFTKDRPFHDVSLPKSPSALNIVFYLFTQSNRDTPQVLTDTNQGLFDSTKDTKVLVHGYGGSAANTWLYDLKENLLDHADYNVIIVNWRNGAVGFPWVAAGNTRLVGPIITSKLQALGASVIDSTHCIGFSMGAQVCGYAGAFSRSNMARISGLDPAGPYYKNKPAVARLDATDAQFVDVIHTAAHKVPVPVGIGQKSGHVDVYANGGGRQPGCIFKRSPLNRQARQAKVEGSLAATMRGGTLSCSHQRAPAYYIESVLDNCNFTAQPCSSFADATQGNCGSCSGSGCQRMGFFSDPQAGTGYFYLRTNPATPYCIN